MWARRGDGVWRGSLECFHQCVYVWTRLAEGGRAVIVLVSVLCVSTAYTSMYNRFSRSRHECVCVPGEHFVIITSTSMAVIR